MAEDKDGSGLRERAFVSAKKVAQLAGVSRSAVSRTFTDGASVSAKTRRKVLEAAETLGYHVNHLARGLSHDRSGIVCLVVSEIPTPYQARMLDVLTRRLQDQGRVAMVINTRGDAESVARALRLTLNYRAEAVVVLSGTPDGSLIDTCLANGQRVILINRDDHRAGPANVVIDNASAAEEAYFLLRRAGCRKLAVVTSTAGTPSLLARQACFERAAARDGIAVAVARPGPTGYEAGAEAARQLFGRIGAPDGIFCVTDLLALGFLDAARLEFGLRVPDDVCVIGFDDIEQAGWQAYGLTTFRHPLDAMADHIAGLVEHPPGPEPALRSFEPLPVWRRTVRPR